MLAFRKMFPVLAVLALIAAIPASAQIPSGTAFTCGASAGAPPLARAEGLAELVGDLVLNCYGGDPSATLLVNVRIILNTNITSNIVYGKDATVGSITEAILSVDDPVAVYDSTKPNPTQCVSAPLVVDRLNETPCSGGTARNMWLGTWAAGNQIEWLGVPIKPPGSTGVRVLRITNVRGDATVLASGSGFVPGQIQMYVSITGTTSVPVSPQPQTVAFVLKGLGVKLTSGSWKQCVAASGSATVTLTEQFTTAFKKQTSTSYNSDTGVITIVDQNTLGGSYFTESGFTNSALTNLLGAGLATQGTRFILRFKGIPNGVDLVLPDQINSSGTPPSGRNMYICIVPGAASDGSGGAALCDGLTATSRISYPSTGQAYAVYEVNNKYPETAYNIIDAFAITVSPQWGAKNTPNVAANFPGLGAMTASASFAPINTTNQMSGTAAPEPRFMDSGVDTTFVTLNACRTLILYPFLTNQAGFDTGVVIVNTSNDPISGTALNQTGACTLYYYGDQAPAAVPTPAINAGEHLSWTLSGGGNVIARPTATVAGAPGFQGYMFAVCLFQYAHGYAFITKQGATDIAHGYIALIVPDRTRLAEPFATAGGNTGEQLAF